MKAAVVEAFGKPLVLREWDTPTPAQDRFWSRPKLAGYLRVDRRAVGRIVWRVVLDFSDH